MESLLVAKPNTRVSITLAQFSRVLQLISHSSVMDPVAPACFCSGFPASHVPCILTDHLLAPILLTGTLPPSCTQQFCSWHNGRTKMKHLAGRIYLGSLKMCFSSHVADERKGQRQKSSGVIAVVTHSVTLHLPI